ncbi:MAG: hypothetical protein PWQ12_564 [Clostridiales bacterium]|jgi:uncharacterized membrane protein YsdA (DUF1294 family)|nr:hypothetical protein [Clostridiales bacterium]
MTIIIYLTAINLISFLAMYADKRFAVHGKRRISERTLMALAFIGGAFGMMSGMMIWKHKLSKPKFTVGGPLFFLLHWGIFVWFFTR